ncbi:MAG: THUMP domain-containing protein [Spirochaetes bacterium]|nr:THUMP domain-containing protein [Spirochaetota bacterium]
MNYSNSPKAIQRRVFQHVIQKPHTFFAVVQPGFEQIAYQELSLLGIHNCAVIKGGITFRGGLEQCFAVNYYSRVVTRVLMRLTHFRAYHFNEIYRTLKEFPWELYISNGVTVDIEVSVHKSKLHHTQRIAEEVKKAILKRLGMFAMQCNVSDTLQKIFIRFDHDECMVSLDSSGQPLYKRGYKQYISEAPLRETTAAALLFACNASEYDTIIDPMCGSGTFPIEAWCMVNGYPPGANRTFAFMHWPSFRKQLFKTAMRSVTGKQKEVVILAGDSNPEMVAITKQNSSTVGAMIDTYIGDFLKDKKEIGGSKVLCIVNPPYGKRIATGNEVAMYTRLAHIFKQWYPQWSFCVVIPSRLRDVFNVPVSRQIHFTHGGIKVTAMIALRGQ